MQAAKLRHSKKILISLNIFLSTCTKKQAQTSFLSTPSKPILVAHALGGLNGVSYINCKECFEHSYDSGLRYFEMDFMMTADGKIAGIHNGQESDYGLPVPFTMAQFKASSYHHTTPLSGEDIGNLAREKKDWYLVTDIKTDNRAALKQLCKIWESNGLSCEDRIIPQIYQTSEIEILKEIPFKRIIFTLYRFGNRPRDVFEFLDKNPNIWAVTIPSSWWTKEYSDNLKARHVLGFVHTVNEPNEAKKRIAEGVSGIYTDFISTL